MSVQEWQERIRRFQINDLLITLVVIVVVVALVIYESLVIVQGKPSDGNSITQGPLGRILLGLLVAITYFKNRQTHRDVIQDVGATTELRETMDTQVAPAIRDATDKMKEGTGGAIEHEATVKRLLEEVRVQRHDFLGKLAASEGLRELAEIERRTTENNCAKMEARVNELTTLLARAAEGKKPDAGN